MGIIQRQTTPRFVRACNIRTNGLVSSGIAKLFGRKLGGLRGAGRVGMWEERREQRAGVELHQEYNSLQYCSASTITVYLTETYIHVRPVPDACPIRREFVAAGIVRNTHPTPSREGAVEFI